MSGVTDLVALPAQLLKAGQDKFFGHLVIENERLEIWRTVANLTLVVSGSILAGMGKLSGIADPHASWMAGVGLAMVAVGSIFIGVFDFRRSRLTTQAKDALAVAGQFVAERDEFQRQLETVEALDKRRRFLLIAVQQMHEAVERMPHGTPLVTVIETMLDAGSADLAGAIGFDAGEKWALAIFQRVKDPDGGKTEVLSRIVVHSADRQRENKPGNSPRNWKKKEGFAGACWQHDDEVIEADMRVPEVAAQYFASKNNQKPGDEERYVSVAVIPIKVGSGDGMWGCVTATSNIAGRWRRAVNDPREQNVMVVRQFAQIVAMQVALRDGATASGVSIVRNDVHIPPSPKERP